MMRDFGVDSILLSSKNSTPARGFKPKETESINAMKLITFLLKNLQLPR